MTRKVLAALVAAAVAAVLVGGVARLLMRLVTMAAGHPRGFSVSGTLGIIAIFFLAALPGSVVAAFARRRRSAVLFIASALLCYPATGVAREELGDTTALDPTQWLGVGAATLGVYATILALPVVALVVLDLVGEQRGDGRRGDQRTRLNPGMSSVRR